MVIDYISVAGYEAGEDVGLTWWGVQLVVFSCVWVLVEKMLYMVRDHTKVLAGIQSRLLMKYMIYHKLLRLSPMASSEFSEG